MAHMGVSYWAFLVAAALVIVAPGPDFAVVLRNGAAGGRGTGVATSLGTATGILVHSTAATIGLSALLAASGTAFTAVKIAGAVYLCWLGVQSLRAAWSHRHERGPVASSPAINGSGGPGRGRAFRQGVLTNVLNPKVAIFFLTFLPQFVSPGQGSSLRMAAFAILGITYAAVALVWLLTVVVATATIRGFLNRVRVRQTVDAVMGTVFLGFGLRLVSSRG